MRECIINLARIKETVGQSLVQQAPSQGLDSVPSLIRGIKAGLLMLNKTRAMEIVDRIGGLLMYGIPNMKLDKDVVQRRVDLMAAEGVEFITGIEIGVDMPTAKLTRDYDAVVLCGGATKPRDLPVPGRQVRRPTRLPTTTLRWPAGCWAGSCLLLAARSRPRQRASPVASRTTATCRRGRPRASRWPADSLARPAERTCPRNDSSFLAIS